MSDRSLPGGASRIARAMACCAVAALMLLAACTVADIVMRYVFARPIRGFVDMAALAGAVMLAACFPHVLASRGNITIDALGNALGPATSRWLDRFAALVSAAFFGVMAWQYWRFAAGLRHDGDTIPVLRWPVWPWWAAVALLVFIAAVTALLTVDAKREGESP